ncbi:hypothetical protein ACA910_007706 [Epithemia clementina (nom. ined.)]
MMDFASKFATVPIAASTTESSMEYTPDPHHSTSSSSGSGSGSSSSNNGNNNSGSSNGSMMMDGYDGTRRLDTTTTSRKKSNKSLSHNIIGTIDTTTTTGHNNNNAATTNTTRTPTASSSSSPPKTTKTYSTYYSRSSFHSAASSSSSSSSPSPNKHNHHHKNGKEPSRLVRVPSNSGRVSPASVSSFSRRMSPAVVTAYYDPSRARPELETILRGRPMVKLNPFAIPSPPSEEGIEIQEEDDEEEEEEEEEEDDKNEMEIEKRQHNYKQQDKEEYYQEEKKENEKDLDDLARVLAMNTAFATSLVDETSSCDFSSSRQTDDASMLHVHQNVEPRNDESSVFEGLPADSSSSNPNHSDQRKHDNDNYDDDDDGPVYSWTMDPPPLSLETWSEQPAEEFKVRGPTYFKDGGVKQNSEPSVLKLFAVDLIQVTEPLWKTGLSQHPEERIQRALRREQETGRAILPDFVFVVNLLVPGANNHCFYHWAGYYGTNDRSILTDTTTPFGRLAKPFFFGSHDLDAFRARIFKLIPRVADGNFVVRTAVGSRPSLLGRKMKQHFIFDPNTCSGSGGSSSSSSDKGTKNPRRSLEILIDISSNAVANRIVKLVLGYAKSLAIDLMFLLEAGNDNRTSVAIPQEEGDDTNDGNSSKEQEPDTRDTLPERILGGVRIKNIDFVAAQRPCATSAAVGAPTVD